MDPIACLKEICETLESDGATKEVKQKAEHLVHWLDCDGFLPSVSRRELTALLACVVLARPDQPVGKPKYTD